MGVSVAMASRSERCSRSISRRMDQELYRVDQKVRESGAGTARAVSNPEIECWTRYAGSNTNLYWRIFAPLFFSLSPYYLIISLELVKCSLELEKPKSYQSSLDPPCRATSH
jgi:hypothetical protein